MWSHRLNSAQMPLSCNWFVVTAMYLTNYFYHRSWLIYLEKPNLNQYVSLKYYLKLHISMSIRLSQKLIMSFITSRWQTWGCVCRNFCFETKKCPHVFLLPLWIVLGKILMKKYSEMIQNCANDHKSCLWVQINSVFLLKTSF